jgi:N-acetylglucosamine-6-phosphate deacetylase
MVFANVGLILPDRVIPRGWLRVENRIIAGFNDGDPPPAPAAMIQDGRGGWLAPGFIDLHVHGALGCDFMQASDEAFTEILRHHAKGGTTTVAATSVSATWPEIEAMIEIARRFRDHPALPGVSGVHLEGPWLSPAKPGAHEARMFTRPDRAAVERVVAWRDIVQQVTLAPELPGAAEAIATLTEAGIVVSAGHSDAWDEDVAGAMAAGLGRVTHLFNAMSGARRRGAYRVAGLLECALAEPRITAEIIADGHHVSPTLLRLAHRAKGTDGLCLVTDATAACGLPEGADYRLGGVRCVVRNGAGFLADEEVLAGSAARMIDCVRKMVQHVGVSLVEAVRMATLVPARTIGQRMGAPPIGRLEVAAAADLVWMTPELEVAGTWRGGERIA